MTHSIPQTSHLPASKRILSVLTITLSFFLALFAFPAFSDDAEDYYQKGMDKMRNEPEIAVKYLEKAAKGGHVKAQYALGRYYYFPDMSFKKIMESNSVPDMAPAFAYFKMAADQDMPEAIYMLGSCYEYGVGVQKNINEAINCYKRASGKGISDASFDLARIYENNNAEETIIWYKKAAEQGNSQAIKKLASVYEKGTCVPKDLTEAFNWYKKVAENTGEANDILFVAEAYEKGTYGPKDLTEAFNWYKKVADGGIAEGLYEVGRCYLDGLGVSKDKASALLYFERAADKGSGNAAVKLYMYYSDPEAWERNDAFSPKAIESSKANAFFEKASSLKISDPDLEYIYACKCRYKAIMSYVEKDKQSKVKWTNLALMHYKNAAKAGSIKSARYLSSIYEKGGQSGDQLQDQNNLFVYKNEEEAKKWFMVAVENGDIEAILSLGQQCMKKKDEQGALYWFRKAAELGNAQAKEYVELLED